MDYHHEAGIANANVATPSHHYTHHYPYSPPPSSSSSPVLLLILILILILHLLLVVSGHSFPLTTWGRACSIPPRTWRAGRSRWIREVQSARPH
eukprot:GHVU01218854.1.p1 GENE.GHVU01218854.1~~GHVU01218854.1.p1  ORF type:complete len:104 (-),score=10.22 GHVU01218854.1:286-567(-)